MTSQLTLCKSNQVTTCNYRFLIHDYSCLNKRYILFFCDIFKNHSKIGQNKTKIVPIFFYIELKCFSSLLDFLIYKQIFLYVFFEIELINLITVTFARYFSHHKLSLIHFTRKSYMYPTK